MRDCEPSISCQRSVNSELASIKCDELQDLQQYVYRRNIDSPKTGPIPRQKLSRIVTPSKSWHRTREG